MTEGYKCDRCGSFESGMVRQSPTPDLNGSEYRRLKYGYVKAKSNGSEIRKIRKVDLCNSCRQDLTEWLGDD